VGARREAQQEARPRTPRACRHGSPNQPFKVPAPARALFETSSTGAAWLGGGTAGRRGRFRAAAVRAWRSGPASGARAGSADSGSGRARPRWALPGPGRTRNSGLAGPDAQGELPGRRLRRRRAVNRSGRPAQLYLSTKTSSYHLGAHLAKLGIRTPVPSWPAPGFGPASPRGPPALEGEPAPGPPALGKLKPRPDRAVAFGGR